MFNFLDIPPTDEEPVPIDPQEQYMGVELEVDFLAHETETSNRFTTGQELFALSDRERLFYLKHDGSIPDERGFEVVSHPATLGFHETRFPWPNVIEACTSSGYGPSRYTGLHVHVSKQSYGESILEIDVAHTKLIILLWRIFPQIRTISRRHRNSDAWFRYAIPNHTNFEPSFDEGFKSFLSVLPQIKALNRYTMLNHNHANTLEFRFFAGTNRLDELLASMEFIDYMNRFIAEKTVRDIYETDWTQFITGSGLDDYGHLPQFLIERRLR